MDAVRGFLEQRFTSIEDSGMLVTGLKLGGQTQTSLNSDPKTTKYSNG